MMQDKTPELKHQEAYAFLRYDCSNCGAITNVWNSRDGESNLTIPSRCCEGKMSVCENPRYHFKSKSVPDFCRVDLVIINNSSNVLEYISLEEYLNGVNSIPNQHAGNEYECNT
jgi:hypothetical protein